MTLLEQWDETDLTVIINRGEEIRRAIAIAQAVEECDRDDVWWIFDRADELLGGQMSLPPLPSPPVLGLDIVDDFYRIVETYGRACRAAALEEAAKVCDAQNSKQATRTWQYAVEKCAAAIRALK